jgi:enterochelin esterase family protein
MPMVSQDTLFSPRLAALQQALLADDGRALEQFWHEVTARGAPLVEPMPHAEDHVLVTFLWRATPPITNVVVVGGLAGWGEFSQQQMTRLLDSDVWFRTYPARMDLRATYQLSPNDSLVDAPDVTDWAARTATWQTDPLNPHTYTFPSADAEPTSTGRVVSLLELPAAPPQPWITPRPGIPMGRVERHRLRSAILGNERDVWVYIPPDYTPGGQPYDLLILFDGPDYIRLIPTPTILDNLLTAGRLAPHVALLIDSLDQETRNRELPCYPPFCDFLGGELLPWAHQHYHITSDPARTIIGGSSFGGLAAAFAGLRHPELFGNVLSQSGTFWWYPGFTFWSKPVDQNEGEWLARQFMAAPRLSLRFYLDVGLLERGSDLINLPDQVDATRHMRDSLQAKGYMVRYAEFYGGHEYLCWRGTLADGLLALTERRIFDPAS